MSHDRGCSCGRERYEYDECDKKDCWKKKNIIPSETRTIKAEYTIEYPQELQYQYGIGNIPVLLYVIFSWGKFGRWLSEKTYNIRKRLNWLSLEEEIVDILVLEITKEIDKEILEKLEYK